MFPHNVFFFGALFFLLGVLLKSIGWSVSVLLVFFFFFLFFLIIYQFRKDRRLIYLAGLSLFIVLGALYYTWDDIRFRDSNFVFNESIEFTGLIKNDPTDKITYREGVMVLDEPLSGKILLRTESFVRYEYGDRLRVTGKIERPFTDWYAKFLAKERISGVVAFPREVEVVGEGEGWFFKKFLFGLRDKITEAYDRALPAKEAAFLSGITLGDRTRFSDSFLEAMSLSGTTHLTALSGLHISIIIFFASFIFASFLGKRRAFLPLILFLFGFVIMTGARPSVIRAAIMGGLVLAAFVIGREYYFRNAIILAAVFLVLINPKMLYFDLGFQLSFLALLGIVYLRPALINLLKIADRPGFLSWRDYLLVTISAQLAVVPLIISAFDNFSPISFLANTIILVTVPPTMVLGFLIALFHFISPHLSLAAGWLAMPLLKFEVGMIEFFGNIGASTFSLGSWPLFIFYYLVMISFVIYMNYRKPIIVRPENEILMKR